MSESELRSDDDIEAILKIAVSQQGIETRTLRDRLMASAEELGLTPEQVALAEEKWAREESERRDLAEFTAMRRRSFWARVASLATLSAAAVAVNLMTDHNLDWAMWVLIWSGYVILSRGVGTFFPHSDRFQRRFQRWREERDRKVAEEDEE